MVTEVHAARLTKFLLWKSIVGLSLAAMIFLSDVVAEHMFTFFSQVNSDSKPVKIMGKESEFSISQHWNRSTEVAFEPIGIADKNLIRQVWFCFLNFALFSDSLLIISITENMHAST